LNTLQQYTDKCATDPRNLTGQFIIDLFQREHGQTISPSSASIAKRELARYMYGSVDSSFEKLENYLHQQADANLGSLANVETLFGHFYRSIFIPAFCISAFEYCQNVIAIDGVFNKYCFLSNYA